MPILKPSTPPKKNQKPAGKTLPPKKGGISTQNKPGFKNKIQAPPPPPPPPARREPSWWEKLSPERKLDVVGIGLALFGILLILGLASANRSVPIGLAILFFFKIFGWGLYILPIGLFIFGVWLIIRKIERIPPLSIERALGSLILFLWLLTAMHVFATSSNAAFAEDVGELRSEEHTSEL